MKGSFRLFPSFISILLAFCYGWARRNTEDSHLPLVVVVVGIAQGLFLGPFWLEEYLQKSGRWWARVLPLTFVFFWGFCFGADLIAAIGAEILFSSLGYAMLIWELTRRRASPSLSARAAAAVTALGIAGTVWGGAKLSPLLPERLWVGDVHPDTLMFLASARLFETFGISTIGVDGLIHIPYHHGCHWALVRWAHLLGVSPAIAYALIYPVVFIPLVFQGFLSLAGQLARSSSDRVPQESFVFWAGLVVVALGMLPSQAQSQMTPGLGWTFFGISESYTLGLFFLFVCLSLALCFRETLRSDSTSRRFDSRTLLFLGLPLSLGALGLVKASSLVLVLFSLSWAFIRRRLYRRPIPLAGFCWGAVIGLLVLLRVATKIPLSGAAWDLLKQVPSTGQPFFYLVLMAWLLLSLLIVRAGWKIEGLVIYALMGALPGIVVSIPQGNALYFMLDPMYVASAVCLAHFLENPPSLSFHGSPGWLMLLPLAFAVETAYVRFSSFRHSEGRNAHATPVSETLQTLSNLSPAEKRSTALFIPQSNTAYWEMTACSGSSFIAPAITGLALVDGMPPLGCKASLLGYQYYAAREKPQPSPTGAELCALARSRGFGSVIELSSPALAQFTDCEKS